MNNFIKKVRIYGIRQSLYFVFIEAKRKLFDEIIRSSFAQHGEDLIIDKLLNYKKKGVYVDIGAYDPTRFSNTKKFYLRGWRGINIDPNITNYQKFVKSRPDDINLNIGVGNSNDKLTFYNFIPETLSTFSKLTAELQIKEGYLLAETKKIQVNKLRDVLNKLNFSKKIDFISIDTEGFELEVLNGNDWTKFRPVLICIESVKHSKKELNNHQGIIHKFIINKGYKLAFNNGLNSIYKLVN